MSGMPKRKCGAVQAPVYRRKGAAWRPSQVNDAGAFAGVGFNRRNRGIGFPAFAAGIVNKFERVGDGEKG